MSFFGILLLFVCFCLVTALIDLVKDFIRARMMKREVDQAIDSAVGTVWRSVLKYQVAREHSKRAASDPTGMNEFDEHGNFRSGGEF